ncbi:DUF6882 domain-containing protein [Enemella sp. A6]|uniref:DUF6882 domain-containing protein n=1 Tax=Enemella sp. A6 TaxID=3440152 RepID=UPI003EB81856
MSEERTHDELNRCAAAYSAVVAERQAALAGMHDDSGWDVDLGAGTLTLGDLTVQVAVLGSYAEVDNTWLWGWANETLGVDLGSPIFDPGRWLRRQAATYGIWELDEPEFELSGVRDVGLGPAGTVAIAAVGLLGAQAMYVTNRPGGKLYLAVLDQQVPAPVSNKQNFAQRLMTGTKLYPGHDRLAVQTYANVHRLQVANADRTQLITFADGAQLEVQYDDAGTITNFVDLDAEPAGTEPVTGR